MLFFNLYISLKLSNCESVLSKFKDKEPPTKARVLLLQLQKFRWLFARSLLSNEVKGETRFPKLLLDRVEPASLPSSTTLESEQSLFQSSSIQHKFFSDRSPLRAGAANFFFKLDSYLGRDE